MRALILCLLVISACGPVVIDAARYSTVCAETSDCIAVPNGDPCDCSCDEAAIAVSEKPKYDREVASIQPLCGAAPRRLCSPCVDRHAVCATGHCKLVP